MMKIKNVQCIVGLVFFFLFTNQILAAEWIYLGSSSNGDMYYDKSSIKEVNKNIIRVWHKTVYNENGKKEALLFLKNIGKVNAISNPYTLSFEVRLLDFNCDNEQYRVSSFFLYDDKGDSISSISDDKWIYIAPDTAYEALKNIVCSVSKISKTKNK